jgi:Na+/H+ antiporter NhaD/arsenite permease-like protein
MFALYAVLARTSSGGYAPAAMQPTLHPLGPRAGRTPAIIGGIGVAALACIALVGVFPGAVGGEGGEHPAGAPSGWVIGSMPFAVILLAIAILPLVPSLAGWWHQNRNKLLVSVAVAFVTLAYLAVAEGKHAASTAAGHAIVHEFVPFMSLLFALYVVTGGIGITGDLTARPRTTTAFLAFGALIASVVGTTGASMLLIRPLLATISERTYRVHTVVFFIFLVSNIGGTLLPIGDPPLFMGFLKGVPFFWTLILWKEWAFCVAVLLTVYYVTDSILWAREPVATLLAEPMRRTPLRVSGWLNVLWLALIIATVATVEPSKPLPFTSWHPPSHLREGLLLAIAGLSMLLTPKSIRVANTFSFGAILEVAAIFIGIFVAMQVPLQVLHARGGDLGLHSPGQFFWLTGILSSFLDNAPTYVVFLGVAMALPVESDPTLLLRGGDHVSEPLLVAISLGAVFMGANTYIGNGPNFMVKSIAEESGLRMPSFFGYMLWSAGVLLPLFVLVHWLFL